MTKRRAMRRRIDNDGRLGWRETVVRDARASGGRSKVAAPENPVKAIRAVRRGARLRVASRQKPKNRRGSRMMSRFSVPNSRSSIPS